MRPVGKRIIFALQILEREGASTSRNISKYMDFVDKENVRKYLSRAVTMGLALMDKSTGINIYTVVNGWRDNLHASASTKVKPTKKVIEYKRPVNSVWELGSR